jgi:hypothetical protein
MTILIRNGIKVGVLHFIVCKPLIAARSPVAAALNDPTPLDS